MSDSGSCCANSCPCTANCSSPLPSRPLGVTRKKTFLNKNDSHSIIECLEWDPRAQTEGAADEKKVETAPEDVDAGRFETSSAKIGSFVDKSTLGKAPKCNCCSKAAQSCDQNDSTGLAGETSADGKHGNPVTSVSIETSPAAETQNSSRRSFRRPVSAPQVTTKPKASRPRVADFRFYEFNNLKQIQRRLKIDSFHRQQERARISHTLAKTGGIENTRELSSSLVSTIANKPPFHDYGEANIRPVSGGIIYGDYLSTHNVKPDVLPNRPKVPQSYFNARIRLENKRQENLKALELLKNKTSNYYGQAKFPSESEYWAKEYEKPIFAHEIAGRSLFNARIGISSTGGPNGSDQNSYSDTNSFNSNPFAKFVTADDFAAYRRELSAAAGGKSKEYFVPMNENKYNKMETNYNTNTTKKTNNSLTPRSMENSKQTNDVLNTSRGNSPVKSLVSMNPGISRQFQATIDMQ